MAQERISKPIAERRCPNCGTRVARDAESCFMCGYDLRREPSRKRQISWIDALLVLAVLLVLFFWWQAGNRQPGDDAVPTSAAGLPAEEIPFLPSTPTATPTPVATAEPPPAEPAQPSGTVEHTVVQGETLLSIAINYGVTVEDIQRVNSISGDLIRPGDKLTIPNQQAVIAPPAGSQPRGPVSNFAYTVQNGDTIISIASRLGSTVEEILTANGLTASDLIRPGDTLNIPVRQVPTEVLQSTVPGSDGATGEIYGAPQSTAPADRAAIARTEAVLLRWVSVDILQPDEWYVVLLYPQSPDARQFPSIWTKATSHRIELDYAPESEASADYSWQVSVVRVGSTADGGYKLEAASPPSELRRFTWGDAVAAP